MGRQFPVLRGLATVFVLVNHSIALVFWMVTKFGYRTPSTFERVILVTIKDAGVVTVPIFLLVSGAFFAFANRNRSLSGSYKMVFNNIRIVFWPYLVWTVLYMVMVYFLLDEKYSVLEFLHNLVVGYPFNFVPLLIFFYLLAPLLIKIGQRYPIQMLAVILIYQLFLTNVIAPGALGFEYPSWTYYLTPPIVRETLSYWAIYFPLGIVYNEYARKMFGNLIKLWKVILFFAICFYILNILDQLRVISFSLAGFIAPLFAILLVPLLRRDMVPFCAWLEEVGKKSYGFYLANLVVITLSIFILRAAFPWLLEQYLILAPVLFLLTLYVPWGLMRLFEIQPQRVLYRYVFG